MNLSIELKEFVKDLEKKFISPDNYSYELSITLTLLICDDGEFQLWPRIFWPSKSLYNDIVDNNSFYGGGSSLEEAIENLKEKLSNIDIKFAIVENKLCKIIPTISNKIIPV